MTKNIYLYNVSVSNSYLSIVNGDSDVEFIKRISLLLSKRLDNAYLLLNKKEIQRR